MAFPEDFSVMDFPHTPRVGCVYVLSWVAEFLGEEVPFYVGQTDKVPRRMLNYDEAQFSCPTDFIVGKAIEYLEQEKRFHIVVKYRRSSDEEVERRNEESDIIEKLRSRGLRLLNAKAGGPSYDYDKMPKEKENKAEYDRAVEEQRNRVRDFCEELIEEVVQRRQKGTEVSATSY